MIVWEGRGILIVLVLIALFFLAVNLLPSPYLDYAYVISFLGTGIFTWHFGNNWNNKVRVVTDKETGQELNLKSNHSLFWIPMQYWAFVLGFFGLLVLDQIISEM